MKRMLTAVTVAVMAAVGLVPAAKATTLFVDVPVGTVQTNLTAAQLTAFAALGANDWLVKTGGGELVFPNVDLEIVETNDLSNFAGTIAVSNGIYTAGHLKALGKYGYAQVIVADGASLRLACYTSDQHNAYYGSLKLRVSGSGADGLGYALATTYSPDGLYSSCYMDNWRLVLDGDTVFSREGRWAQIGGGELGTIDLRGHKLTLRKDINFVEKNGEKDRELSRIVSSGTIRFQDRFENEYLRLQPLPTAPEARSGTVEIASGIVFDDRTEQYGRPAPAGQTTIYDWKMVFEEAKTYTSAKYRILWDAWHGEMTFPAGSVLEYVDGATTRRASVAAAGIVSFQKGGTLHVGPGSDVTLTGGATSLRATNEDGVPNAVAQVTADSFLIGGSGLFVDVAADTSLVLAGTAVNGTIAELSGAGTFTFAAGSAVIASARSFTGAVVVRGGSLVAPRSLQGRITAENGAVVVYDDNVQQPAYKSVLTVSGYTGASTLTNFPVLVRLSGTSVPGFSYDDCRDDGADVRFFAPDLSVEYPCEFERWNPDGESLIWVRIPRLAAGTTFLLTYGGAPRTVSPTDVWKRSEATGAGDFAGVWHMAEERYAVRDSTGHGMTAYPIWKTDHADRANRGYSASTNREGKVGSARHVSEATTQGGPKLFVPREKYLARNLGGVFTASTWMRPTGSTSLSSYPRPFSFKYSSGSTAGWEIHTRSNGEFVQRAGSTDNLTVGMSSSCWAADTWAYYTFVYNGATLEMYANGVRVGGPTAVAHPASDETDTTTDFYLGGARSEWSLVGDLDEARLLGEASGADWVAADYATQARTDFLTASAVETQGLRMSVVGTLDEIHVTFGQSCSDAAVTLTLTLKDGNGQTIETRNFTGMSAGKISVTGFTGLSRDTAYLVTLSVSGDAAHELVKSVRTVSKVYQLLSGDKSVTSLRADSHGNNWGWVEDETDILAEPVAGYEYIVDATVGADPTPNDWILRTGATGTGLTDDYVFPGSRLTVKGRRKVHSDARVGVLEMKHIYPGTFVIPELLLTGGTVLNSTAWGGQCVIESNIVIPSGSSGFIENSAGEGDYRSFTLYGTLSGGGTLYLDNKYNYANDPSYHTFANDASLFSGPVIVHNSHFSYLRTGCVPPGEMPSLVETGIVYRTDHNLFVKADIASDSVNRGVTVESGKTLAVNVAGGCTFTVRNPLYGSGNIMTTGFTTTNHASHAWSGEKGTLKLAADSGSWSGTLTATNGTIVLAGAKPIGEGTLDATGDALVRVVAGTAPYVKAVAPGTRLTVELGEDPDYLAGVGVLRMPEASAIDPSDLELPTLPFGVELVQRHRDGLTVFTLRRNRGVMLIVR